MNFRIAAHILCLPFCVVVLNVFIVWAWSQAPGVLILLPFLAYNFVPSIWGIAYLVLCQCVLILAWKTSPPSWHARWWLIAYNLILVLYIGYLAWWFATGQQVKPIGGYL